MAGFLAAMLPALASAGISAIAQGGPRRQYKWNRRAAQDTYEMNRKIQEEQRAYDAPKAAMARFLEAGLNPRIIYGSGSAGSGGAFPFSYDVAPPSSRYPDVAQAFLQSGQTMAQTKLAEARTSESYVNQALKEMQTEIAKTNPMLNPAVYQSLTESMMAVADGKASEARYLWKSRQEVAWDGLNATITRDSYGAKKIRADVEAAVQKLGLNTVDLDIKNKILESKEFENVVKELNANWLKDAELTPEHVRQGLMLLLGKMVGR